MVSLVKLAKKKLPEGTYVQAFVPELLVTGTALQSMGEAIAARTIFFAETTAALAPFVVGEDGNAKTFKTPAQVKLLTLYVRSVYGAAMSSLEIARHADPRLCNPQSLKEVLSIARQIVSCAVYVSTPTLLLVPFPLSPPLSPFLSPLHNSLSPAQCSKGRCASSCPATGERSCTGSFSTALSISTRFASL